MRPPIVRSLTLAVAFCTAASAQAPKPRPVLYRGACEPSAAVALASSTFVLADDEKQKKLFVLSQEQPDKPQDLPLPAGFETEDMEGAARIGDDLYWIGSHSRNRNGEEQPERHRLFALRVAPRDGTFSAEAVGRPYTTLLADLQRDERFNAFKLACASELAPEEPGGLNIEGLGASPDGKLLIGFRNPTREGKALIVTLNNPRAVLDGAPASFGAPVELDLNGLGIRSLEFWPAGEAYVIIAGSTDDSGRFQAYRWSGQSNDPPEPIASANFAGLIPEAAFLAAPSDLMVLSDEGAFCFKPDGFRSLVIKLPD